MNNLIMNNLKCLMNQAARTLRFVVIGVAATTLLAGCGGSKTEKPKEVTKYAVTAEAGAGGAVAPTSQQVEAGKKGTISVTPNAGYKIASVTGCGGSLSNTTYTTGAITSACKVTASFSKLSYTVSTQVNVGGTWSPASATVEHGDTTAFTLSWEATQFRLLSTQGCNGSYAGNTFTTGAITSACTVAAEFETNQPPQCNAGNNTNADSGDTVTIVGTASDDEGIASWLWEQVSGPAVVILAPTTNTLEFVAPEVAAVTNLVFRLTVTDTNGATASDEVTVTVHPKQPEVAGVALVAGDARAIGDTLTVHLDSTVDFQTANWEVVDRTSGSQVAFNKVNSNEIEFTIAASTFYDIKVTSHSGLTEQTLSVLTSNVPEPDPAALEGYDGVTPLDEVIGVVLNQSWVVSDNLAENDLRTFITDNYSELQPVSYDNTQGLLIEYTSNSILAREQLEVLKLQPGIAGVHQRVHTGANADVSFVLGLPDDGDTWGDGGSNWQLEAEYGANLVGAWETTTGNSNVRIAVIDAGFYSTHEEIDGRFSHILTGGQSAHGNATAGAIVGASNNGVGVTGINHQSQAVLARWGVHSYTEALAQSDTDDLNKIKVVNNSWGPMGNGSASVNEGIYFSRSFRQIALHTAGLLHVWAAGNDGGPATFQNGALHLNDSGSYSPLSNVMVVAAHGSDGVLMPYSNFGTTVDISAPTEYLGVGSVTDGVSNYYQSGSDTYGSCFSGGFNGTSAAAPVVSGTASLIYSMYPGFSASEVRQILIDSADSFITQRHANVNSCSGGGAPELVDLPNPIPILNAANAVNLAQEIINGKVSIHHTMLDPFTSLTQFEMTSMDSNLALQSYEWNLESYVSDGYWQVVDSGSGGAEAVAAFGGVFDGLSTQHRLNVTVELLDLENNTLVNASRTYAYEMAQVTFVTRDTVSLAPLAGTELQIATESGQLFIQSATTNSDGTKPAWFKPGSYSVYASSPDYQSSAVGFATSVEEPQWVYINMTSTESGLVGSISGQVVNQNDEPIAGASVRISGGEQTNGYFASAVTNSAGEYVISNISKTASNGQPIPSFIMEASASMHSTVVREEVIVLAGLDRAENFRLNEVIYTEGVIYESSFEDGLGGWEATGMWHLEALPGNSLYNLLVEGGYVAFAPDELSDFAYLPQAIHGNFVWWYGEADTGTFIGTQREGDYPLSGGMSVSSNDGTLTSPPISLSDASNPQLDLQTWWEIESVNPNSNGFDLMHIAISQDGENFITVRTLNPYVDPNDSDRDAKPFSSAGFNRMPVWANETLDLSSYAGSEIRIRFTFSTIDSLYNGFRGWVIDNLRVVDISYDEVSPSLASGKVKATKSEAFMKQHRLPLVQPNATQQTTERENRENNY